MEEGGRFFRRVCALAVPVALQSMLQASFSAVDQLMIGQLGSESVAGVGLAGKLSSILTVLVSAIAAVAGILLSQCAGQKNDGAMRRCFRVNLACVLGLAAVFTALCALLPERLMGLYTQDAALRAIAANYLRILSLGCIPAAAATLLATLLRCNGHAAMPLLSSALSAALNTALNFLLIFGAPGLAPMGVRGAAVATVLSQLAGLLLLFALGRRTRRGARLPSAPMSGFNWRQYAAMLLPLLACELLWSLGENVYAGIYGHIGPDACAAMALLNPVQSLLIGALCGLSQAAGIIVGKLLGSGASDAAYRASRRLMLYGAVGAVALSALVALTRARYVELYRVEDAVRESARQILLSYALVAPFKVENMILGGGVLRSGGQTGAVMWIDLCGTWLAGVPLGLLAAFVWHLPIAQVYFLLSTEECLRLGISLAVFRRRGWMRRLDV